MSIEPVDPAVLDAPFTFREHLHKGGAIIAVDETEANSLMEAKDALRHGIAIEENYDQVIESYLSIQEHVARSAFDSSIRGPQSTSDVSAWRRRNNHRAAELLSTVRQYIDHTKHSVSQIARNLGTAPLDIKKPFSDQYDWRLGYRVMECLRNVSQHSLAPLHGVSWGGGWKYVKGKAERVREQKFEPSIVVEVLRQRSNFKPSVLQELEQQAEGEKAVPFLPLLKDYLSGIAEIHAHYRAELRTSFETAESRYDVIFERAKQRSPGISRGYLVAKDNAEPSEEISASISEMRKELAKRNTASAHTFMFDIRA